MKGDRHLPGSDQLWLYLCGGGVFHIRPKKSQDSWTPWILSQLPCLSSELPISVRPLFPIVAFTNDGFETQFATNHLFIAPQPQKDGLPGLAVIERFAFCPELVSTPILSPSDNRFG
jgi:hypothetical protein